MKPSSKALKEIQLRLRLFRRVFYRVWKSIVLRQAKFFIQAIDFASQETATLSTPAIFLSSFETPLDFWILSFLFQEKELTFLSPRKLPEEKILRRLQKINRVLYLDGKINFRFLRELLTAVRDFNRSIVISPQAAVKYMSKIPVDPVLVVRIAMMANVPIVPVIMKWQGGKCRVWVGSKIYISPRAEEFKDIFFKRKGVRKFRDLPSEDLILIGKRIFSKIGGEKD